MLTKKKNDSVKFAILHFCFPKDHCLKLFNSYIDLSTIQ